MRDLIVFLLERAIPIRVTMDILDELFRSLAPKVPPQRLERQRPQLEKAFEDAFIEGYHHRVDGLCLPDLGDRHVLAAAIEGGAKVIVTFNLRDFPADATRPYGVTAVHPDAWLSQLLEEAAECVDMAIRDASRQRRRPPQTAEEIALALRGAAPQFSARLLQRLP